MDFEKAKAKATTILKTRPNKVTEYSDAWFFYNDSDKGKEDAGIVIFKKNGKSMPFAEYIIVTNNSGNSSTRRI